MGGNCQGEPIQKIITDEERQKVGIVFLSVWGMGCPNCAAHVRYSLLSLNGVANSEVDHNTGIAAIAYNPDLATVEMLISAVLHAGNDGRHEYGARLLSKEVLQ